jgi:regulator of replication initiation timing
MNRIEQMRGKISSLNEENERMNRIEQMRGKISSLKEENERLQQALRDVRERLMHVDFNDLRRAQIKAKGIADNALDDALSHLGDE